VNVAKMRLDTVEGRNELRAKLQDIDHGLATLSLLITNLEKDLELKEVTIRQLQDQLDGRGAGISEHDLICQRVVRKVWVEGCSIYDKEIQRDIEALNLAR
jgi:hypothetical protein